MNLTDTKSLLSTALHHAQGYACANLRDARSEIESPDFYTGVKKAYELQVKTALLKLGKKMTLSERLKGQLDNLEWFTMSIGEKQLLFIIYCGGNALCSTVEHRDGCQAPMFIIPPNDEVLALAKPLMRKMKRFYALQDTMLKMNTRCAQVDQYVETFLTTHKGKPTKKAISKFVSSCVDPKSDVTYK